MILHTPKSNANIFKFHTRLWAPLLTAGAAVTTGSSSTTGEACGLERSLERTAARVVGASSGAGEATSTTTGASVATASSSTTTTGASVVGRARAVFKGLEGLALVVRLVGAGVVVVVVVVLTVVAYRTKKSH